MNDLARKFSIWNLIFPLLVLITFSSADIVWEENFDDSLIDQKGATGSSGGAVVDMAGITNWTIDITDATLSATSDWFRVDGGAFDARDLDGEAIWESEVINISGLSDVTFSLDVSEQGNLEGEGSGVNTDYFDVYYNVDNAGYVKISNLQGTTGTTHTLVDDWNSINISQSIGSGHTSLQLKFVMRNSAGEEYIIFDNVLVETSTVLPVTISHVYPESYGDTIEVTFGTATETGNIGFNIYAIKGKGKKKQWIKLNKELIPGAMIDTIEPQEYQVSLRVPKKLKSKKIGIAGVGVDGTEDRHGPFKIGKQSGDRTVVTPLNWEKVQQQVKADYKARKAAKKAKRKTKRSVKRAIKQLFKEDMVTLHVSENALYRVTHKALMAEGINLVGLKAKQIAISFKDEGTPRYIEGLRKGKWTKESAITFMGEAPNATDALYVKTNHYRLTLNKQMAVASEEIAPLSVKETIIDKNNKYAYTMPLDDPFYEGYFYTLNESATAQYTSTFDMPEALPEGSSELSIHAAVTTKGSHSMSITLNGTPISETTAQNRSSWIITEEVENSLLQERDNTLTFTLYGESDGMDIVAFDKLIIRTDTQEVIEAERPEIVREEKISKKMIGTKKSTDYLIITHPLFMNETLDRYVAQRQGEGWKIEVVNVEDIYTAYSNGMAIAEAIQSYISQQIDRGVSHVQLIGASNHDYHDYLGLGAVSFIPSIYTLTNETVTYTPSDASYVIGEDMLPSIAIGRWPVRTLEEFEHVIDKTLSWRSTHNALLIADQTDSKGTVFTPQMRQMEEKMKAQGYETESVYLDVLNETIGDESVTVAREKIAESMMQGVSILSYSGHGSSSNWSPTGLLKESDIAGIDTSTIAPIMLPFTCLTTYADSPQSTTMAHQLSATQNGAVAIYGATIYSNYKNNSIIIAKVFERLIAGETLGEAVKNTKYELGAEFRDVILNGNLLGDVTLKVK